MSEVRVNENLVKERKKCSFKVQELTNFIDGGPRKTEKRREIENYIISVKELRDEIPEEYLSYKERYENAVRKGCILYKMYMKKLKESPRYNDMLITMGLMYKAQLAVLKDMSPFLVHYGMFLPTILNQASPEQLGEWLPKGAKMIGTYAQTELGHGTFLRGLETTATYDPNTEEFVMNTPTLTAHKWWPGGLGTTANHCIVIAQLYTKGVCRGIHPFLVQIRDLETHEPFPGIKVGDIGPKLGFQTANNGFLGFNNYRIPRMNMLMKNNKVLKDGTYVESKSDKLTYGTMVFIRVTILTDVSIGVSRAVTIAIRYSAVRHQSLLKPDEPEPQILDYVTQQHKLFISIASAHVFRVIGTWLWKTYTKVSSDLNKGNLDQLPELHALTCCLKAVCSKDATVCIEQCRLACGGQGFMLSSNLPTIYGLATASVTYEGEYTVMLLQSARYLVKAWKQAIEGKPLTPTISYLANHDKYKKWENTPTGIIAGFQAVAAGKVKTAYEVLHKHIKSGNDYEDAWNLSSVQLCDASEAHCRAVLCQVFWQEYYEGSTSVSRELAPILLQIAELYLVFWALEKRGDLLIFSSISKDDIAGLQQRYEELLSLIRPNAVGLVDSFDLRDEVLNSTLGSYDGRVYERLMEEAMKNPINKQAVNDSFHKYIKPIILKNKL